MKTVKQTMIKTMVEAYEKVTAQQEENGKTLFGDGTFVIYGQCTGVYYATLYTLKHSDNPYYHDKELLDKAIKSWDYYLTLLRKDGQTHIITYDHSWGYMYEEWNTLHLLNSIELLKNDLPTEKTQEYQEAVDRSCLGILKQTEDDFKGTEYQENIKKHTVANHFLWCITLCYRYGQLKDKPEILAFCEEVINDVCAHQLPFGTWLEGGSLVINYAHTTLGALSLYAHYNKKQNKVLTQAVIKNINYLLNCYYDNLASIGCIDTRNRYEGENGFPYIPGAFADDPTCLKFISKHVTNLYKRPDYLLRSHQALGFYTVSFDSVPDDALLVDCEIADTTDNIIEIDRMDVPIPTYSTEKCNTILIKENGFTIPVCILSQKLYESRWILERQNLYSIYHKDAGLIVGGGHSISSPEFSCFNVISNGTLHYMHSKAEFVNPKHIKLLYGNTECEIQFLNIRDKYVKVKYIANNLKDTEKVIINVPVFTQLAKQIKIADRPSFTPDKLDYGKYKLSTKESVMLDSAALCFETPFYAEYPVYAYNSYVQEQIEEFKNSFMVLNTVLDYKHPETVLTVKLL